MIIEIDSKYIPLPEGSEIPEGQRAVETLRKTLRETMYYYNMSYEKRQIAMKSLVNSQENETRYSNQINELKKAIDALV